VFKYYLNTYAGYLVFAFLNTSLTKTDMSQRSLLIEICHILLTESEYKHNSIEYLYVDDNSELSLI